jgi:hypothetical protein
MSKLKRGLKGRGGLLMSLDQKRQAIPGMGGNFCGIAFTPPFCAYLGFLDGTCHQMSDGNMQLFKASDMQTAL